MENKIVVSCVDKVCSGILVQKKWLIEFFLKVEYKVNRKVSQGSLLKNKEGIQFFGYGGNIEYVYSSQRDEMLSEGGVVCDRV